MREKYTDFVPIFGLRKFSIEQRLYECGKLYSLRVCPARVDGFHLVRWGIRTMGKLLARSRERQMGLVVVRGGVRWAFTVFLNGIKLDGVEGYSDSRGGFLRGWR